MGKRNTTTNLHGEFWAMTYRGHEIAVQHHSTGWMVYLNTVMFEGVRFAEARCAANWLRRKVDELTVAAAA